MSLTAGARLRDEAVRVFQADKAGPIGLAVSGGSDSMAMLWLIVPWARAEGRGVAVATVDHGLREGAAGEAAFVAEVCAGLGLPHEVLRWRDRDGRGNLQARAREARYALLTAWARGRGIGTVALGHTMDDQAETVLLRLARGSGVDGLAGMAALREERGMRWVRPLLGLRRAALRDFLRQEGRGWCEDPSNAAERFDRVKARRALALLAPLGVDAPGLSATADRMAMARAALEQAADAAAAALARVEGGDVVLARPGFDLLAEETRLRLLSDAVRWVGGSVYRPRLAAVQAAAAAARRRTVQGTVVARTQAAWRIGREWAAVRDLTGPVGAVWDGRWRVEGPGGEGLELRALGEAGLAACPGWRATGLPRGTLLCSPAVWRGQVLVAAPLAGRGEGWRARIVADFRGQAVSD